MKSYLLAASCFFTATANSQNYIDNYLNAPFTLTLIADSSNLVSEPRDLEFKPNTDELWVVNKADIDGGTNVIVYHAGLPSQVTEYRKDSHTSHFMLYPSALAFSDIGEFATASESQSSNGGASTFMGPVLWSSDTSIFARVFQSNWAANKPLGSHLDMLHQSPMAMGIAHDTIEAYWVFDGYNSNICKYDFVTNHGPGYENHDNGIIYRYTDIEIQREPNVPSHMVKDKATGWLYIVDTGHKTLIRINTNTGSVVDTLTPPGTAQETLDGYYEVQGVVQEVLDTFTTRPCGIALYNGRLIVGDYDTGDITVYDITGASPVVLGVIATAQPGMEGLEIGTDGKIWFVNNTDDIVYRIDPMPAGDDAAILEITSPAVTNWEKDFYSTSFNLCSPVVTPVATLFNAGTNTLTSATINYSIDNGAAVPFSWTGFVTTGQTASVTLPSSPLASGKHKIAVWTSIPGDGNPANDKKEGSFRSLSPVEELPYSEDFTAPGFPPAGWDYIHYNPNAFMSRNGVVGGFGNSTGCFMMDNFSSYEDMSGQIDYLMLPLVDLGSASVLTTFEFNVAYAKYVVSSTDRLQVLASTDCGNTWTVAYDKEGTALSTAPQSSSAFVPTATQWRHDTISLAPYVGNPEVMFLFVSISDYGNNIYVDDVTVADAGVGISEVPASSSMQVYPSPATDQITFSFYAANSENAHLRISDAAGRIVAEKNVTAAAGKNKAILDISGFAGGIYIAEVKSGHTSERRLITIE